MKGPNGILCRKKARDENQQISKEDQARSFEGLCRGLLFLENNVTKHKTKLSKRRKLLNWYRIKYVYKLAVRKMAE